MVIFFKNIVNNIGYKIKWKMLNKKKIRYCFILANPIGSQSTGSICHDCHESLIVLENETKLTIIRENHRLYVFL